jgi:choline-glycine betaine transporter
MLFYVIYTIKTWLTLSITHINKCLSVLFKLEQYMLLAVYCIFILFNIALGVGGTQDIIN